MGRFLGLDIQVRCTGAKVFRYETHHNTLDCFFLQDRQALCDLNNIKGTAAKNKILYNVSSYARQKLSQEGYRHTRFRTESSRNRKPLSYAITRNILARDLHLAFRIMVEYFLTEA